LKTAVVSIAKRFPDPAEALRSERVSITADLEAISRKLARLAEAQKDQERAFAQVEALGEVEVQALRVWASAT